MKYHFQRPGSKIMHLFRNWGSFWRKHHSYDSIIKEWNQAYFCRSYAVVCVTSPCIAENILGSVWEWGYSNPTLCRKMIIIPIYPFGFGADENLSSLVMSWKISGDFPKPPYFSWEGTPATDNRRISPVKHLISVLQIIPLRQVENANLPLGIDQDRVERLRWVCDIFPMGHHHPPWLGNLFREDLWIILWSMGILRS